MAKKRLEKNRPQRSIATDGKKNEIQARDDSFVDSAAPEKSNEKIKKAKTKTKKKSENLNEEKLLNNDNRLQKTENEAEARAHEKKLNKKQIALISVACVLVLVAVFLIIWFVVLGEKNKSNININYEADTVIITWDEVENATNYVVEYYYRDKTQTESISTNRTELSIERGYGKLYVRVKALGKGVPSTFWTDWNYTIIPPKEYKFNNSIVPYIVSKSGVINFYLYFENLIIDGYTVNNYILTNQIGTGNVYATDFVNETIENFDINDDECLNAAINEGKLYNVAFSPFSSGKTILTVTIAPDFKNSEELIEKYKGEKVTFTVTFDWDKKNLYRAGTYFLRSNDITVSNLENDIEIF